ncbi:LOW QUALITY PROTEIN: hypothetical protein T265_13769 [Opisthorchis viverrini]|uniref:Uncharacterized protein n=1 Tax=Opisthorchis viverrini TaxID=6198 RepID=A0A074ZP68_OPIVI|nr:LOW QUALITY PROTEIN: hypothetical protein T265_13769 [Opisthorchis viverrini]KER27607.1 LOW QUALITY PROTEIN: hypothetical protein T265_13769 [Opisthorchis viverrini]
MDGANSLHGNPECRVYPKTDRNFVTSYHQRVTHYINYRWFSEREFTDRKARDSNLTSESRLLLDRLGQPVSIPGPRASFGWHGSEAASFNATAKAAIELLCGPPCKPGKTASLMRRSKPKLNKLIKIGLSKACSSQCRRFCLQYNPANLIQAMSITRDRFLPVETSIQLIRHKVELGVRADCATGRDQNNSLTFGEVGYLLPPIRSFRKNVDCEYGAPQYAVITADNDDDDDDDDDDEPPFSLRSVYSRVIVPLVLKTFHLLWMMIGRYDFTPRPPRTTITRSTGSRCSWSGCSPLAFLAWLHLVERSSSQCSPRDHCSTEARPPRQGGSFRSGALLNELLSQCLSSLFVSIWRKSTVQDTWDESIMVSISKKGTHSLGQLGSIPVLLVAWRLGTERVLQLNEGFLK